MTARSWAPPGGWLIYAVRFFTFGGWGALYPFFAVWLLGESGFSGAQAGTIAGAAVIANRIGAITFVRPVRRHGKRSVVLVSQAAMIATLAGMGGLSLVADRSVAAWLVFATALGLASSVSSLAQLTLIVSRFAEDAARKAFSCENIALNIAAGVTPLVSALAVTSWPRYYPLAPIVCCLIGMALATRLPREVIVSSGAAASKAAPQAAPPCLAGQARGAGRRRYRDAAVLLPANFLTTVAYAQFYGVFPAYATPEMGERRVGLLLVASSVVIVMLQAVVTKVSAKAGATALIVTANLSLACGCALLPRSADSLAIALTAVLGVTLGEMIYGPEYQTLAVAASRGRPEFGLGVVTFIWGVAESLAVAVGLALVGDGLGGASMAIGSCCGVTAAAIAVAFRARFTRLGESAAAAAPAASDAAGSQAAPELPSRGARRSAPPQRIEPQRTEGQECLRRAIRSPQSSTTRTP